MYFPWHKYEELSVGRRSTLQIFITNRCNLRCNGCFAKNIIKGNNRDISIEEYKTTLRSFFSKGKGQINLIGGEPLLHPEIKQIIDINRQLLLKTTIYTNGYLLDKFCADEFKKIKLRVSLYCKTGGTKSVNCLPRVRFPIEICFMVSKNTTVEELLETATEIEENYNCNVFFISSIRELDNCNKEFFEDTEITMNVLDYKKLVHEFLQKYNGGMEIHISKRGVFESTKTLPDNRCRFANYFIGGKIIQCPYDVVNLKFQKDYSFEKRHCQHNNTCLMSKIKLRPKK